MATVDTDDSRAKKLCECLKKMGLIPEIDSDGDIKFKYEFMNMYILLDSDREYMSISLLNFYEFSEEKKATILDTCNEINKQRKSVKTYYIQNRVSASAELFLQDVTSISEKTFKRYVNAVLSAAKAFVDIIG